MKSTVIAVIATIFAVSSAYAENDKFIHMIDPCEKDCDAKEADIPVGSIVSFTFKSNTKRAIYIGEYCKLDTVTLWSQYYSYDNSTTYFGICERVEKRERTVLR